MWNADRWYTSPSEQLKDSLMEDSSSGQGSPVETSRRVIHSSDLLEEFWSPESEGFLYMTGSLMAKTEDRGLSQSEIDILNAMEQRGLASLSQDEPTNCRSDDKGDTGSAVVGRPIVSETMLMESGDMAGHQEPIKKPRFFGIYPRVQLQVAWRKLTKLGVVLRPKKLRLMDIHSNSPALMNDYERWCQEDAMLHR